LLSSWSWPGPVRLDLHARQVRRGRPADVAIPVDVISADAGAWLEVGVAGGVPVLTRLPGAAGWPGGVVPVAAVAVLVVGAAEPAPGVPVPAGRAGRVP
jgi:hypothetical protein